MKDDSDSYGDISMVSSEKSYEVWLLYLASLFHSTPKASLTNSSKLMLEALVCALELSSAHGFSPLTW